MTSRAESIDFLRWVVAWGDSHRNPFMDYFPYAGAIVGGS